MKKRLFNGDVLFIKTLNSENDPELTKQGELILENAIGKNKIIRPPYVPVGEDFSFYQEKIPGLFIFVGVAPKNQDPQKIALNHSPFFYVEESGLVQGVKALSQLAYGYFFKND
ncbi:hypothetical protein FJY84_03265 [Candidatus Bathyarchaeota archaeon]|nr:hypothetical protein [Candidatus Bathyarchaeota archaeon]